MCLFSFNGVQIQEKHFHVFCDVIVDCCSPEPSYMIVGMKKRVEVLWCSHDCVLLMIDSTPFRAEIVGLGHLPDNTIIIAFGGGVLLIFAQEPRLTLRKRIATGRKIQAMTIIEGRLIVLQTDSWDIMVWE